MNRRLFLKSVAGGALAAGIPFNAAMAGEKKENEDGLVELPEPDVQGKMTLERAIANRRSKRKWIHDKNLGIEKVKQLCWSAQGITDEKRNFFRAAPSAGALYPLELYVAKHDGFWKYIPKKHALECAGKKDVRPLIQEKALGRDWVGKASAVFLFCLVPERTTKKYGSRGERYAIMEVGFAAENLLLQAVALGLGSVPIGAFYDEKMKKALSLPDEEDPMLIVPVGYPDNAE